MFTFYFRESIRVTRMWGLAPSNVLCHTSIRILFRILPIFYFRETVWVARMWGGPGSLSAALHLTICIWWQINFFLHDACILFEWYLFNRGWLTVPPALWLSESWCWYENTPWYTIFRSVEPQGTADNNGTKLNSTPAQTPASAPLPHIPTHAPAAPQLPPNSPFHTAAGHTGQGEESEGRASAPLTEQLQSRLLSSCTLLCWHKFNSWK